VHELAVCGSIAAIVRRNAPDRRVTRVYVRVGQLRQIVPDTLAYSWGLVVAETPLDGSELAIEQVPGRIACRDCGTDRAIGDVPLFVCDACGGYNVAVTAGEELLVVALDLVAA
jgi:hydrogenase nickel incorporation protein HypA/HybF